MNADHWTMPPDSSLDYTADMKPTVGLRLQAVQCRPAPTTQPSLKCRAGEHLIKICTNQYDPICISICWYPSRCPSRYPSTHQDMHQNITTIATRNTQSSLYTIQQQANHLSTIYSFIYMYIHTHAYIHYIALLCITLHYIQGKKLLYIPLHCIALRCIHTLLCFVTLRYVTWQYVYIIVYIYIHISTHTHRHMYIYICAHICVRVCVETLFFSAPWCWHVLTQL